MNSTRERFATLLAMHVPGEDAFIDDRLRLCHVAIQKKPDDSITSQLIEVTIRSVMNRRDRVEIAAQVEILRRDDPEVFAIYEEISQMGPAELRSLADAAPRFQEMVSKLLWYRGENERLIEESKRLGEELLGSE